MNMNIECLYELSVNKRAKEISTSLASQGKYKPVRIYFFEQSKVSLDVGEIDDNENRQDDRNDEEKYLRR